MLTVYRGKQRTASQAADIVAIDRGEVVTMVCHYRALYGKYPRRFMQCWLDLIPAGPVIRPLFLLQFLWRRIPVAEKIIAAQVRSFKSEREAFVVRGGGQYAAGGALEQVGAVVISCQTSGGVLEFAVYRADVGLALHYFGRLADGAGRSDRS